MFMCNSNTLLTNLGTKLVKIFVVHALFGKKLC